MYTVYYWAECRKTTKRAFKETWEEALNFSLNMKRSNHSYEIWDCLERII